MNRRDFLKRLAGAFAGLTLVEAFHLDWLHRQAPEPLKDVDYAFSVGGDYTAVAVYDSRHGFSSFALKAEVQNYDEVLEWYQRVVALGFSVDPKFT